MVDITPERIDHLTELIDAAYWIRFMRELEDRMSEMNHLWR